MVGPPGKPPPNKSRVVVTGAFGYIGLALLSRLAPSRPVVGVGRKPRAAVELPQGVEAHFADTLHAGEVLQPGDALIHLAGGGGAARCQQEPERAARDIVRSTLRLIDIARQRGAGRMLMASTIAVYGTFRTGIDRPFKETDATEPDDLYGTLKDSAEHAWSAWGGGTALRMANVYGAGIGVDLGIQGVAERFARAAASGGDITMYGDGQQRLDLVHVDDVTRAFERALDREPLPPALNIGSGQTYTIAELAAAAKESGARLGSQPTIVRQEAPPGKTWPTRSLDIQLTEAALEWQPSVSLEHGMNELVQMMQHTSKTP